MMARPFLAKVLLNGIFLIAGANFLAFVVIPIMIGGDAINGYAENGRYFLRMHGRTTEVSEAVFNYSGLHAISVFITHALAMVMAVLGWAFSDGQNTD
jgi:hypothetical protein